MEWTIEAMADLARRWDERVRGEVSRFSRVVPEIEERGTVLREPATEARVAAAEARLGVRLAPSYRAFLLVSNGAHASAVGAERIVGSEPERHGLLPVEAVAWAAEADAATVDLWTGPDGLVDPAYDRPPTGTEPETVGYFPPLRRGLLVSRPLESWRLVLVPRTGLVEWELWDMMREETGAYRSFGDFLRFQVERPSAWPRPELADEYADGVRRGELNLLDPLAEIGDARAGELAAAWLERADVSDPVWPADVLAKLSDPAGVPALRRAYARAMDRGSGSTCSRRSKPVARRRPPS